MNIRVNQCFPKVLARIMFIAVGVALMGSCVTAESEVPFKQEWPNTDFSMAKVELTEISSGGPPKDGIPAIDAPKFVSVVNVTTWLHPKEPVIALEIGNQARAYPLQILIYHEIVNDSVAGVPVAVTFCPLCNASMVFERRVEDKVLDFGTTGKLRKSDLVMYDRQTESWWQQFTGEGIVGQYAGTVLRRIRATIIAFEDFKSAYPDGKVLTRDTGFRRAYGSNPYRGYDRIGASPFLFHDTTDPRLPAMERVISVQVDGSRRIYPFSTLTKHPVINDELNHIPIVVFSKRGTLSALDKEQIVDSRTIPSAAAYLRRVDKRTLHFHITEGQFRDSGTGSTWDITGRAVAGPLRGRRLAQVDDGVHFAFAWLAFNPDSMIYGREQND